MDRSICNVSGCYNYGSYCRLHRDTTPIKKVYPIAKESEKRKEENKQLKKIVKVFKKDHPRCQAALPGCTKIATDLHHKKHRRTKDDRTNPKNFMALCRNCHSFAEANPKQALALGLLEKAIN